VTAFRNPLVVPYRFERSVSVAEAKDSLEREISVAGRLVALRRHGGIVFGDLRDASGDIQVLFRAEDTASFELLNEVTLGSWIGAAGRVTTSQSGETTIAATSWQLLARCRTGWVDGRRGLVDPETRLRRRWIDLWADPAALRRFQRRSRIISSIRRYFEELGFIEVETPILHTLPGGASARPFVTHHNALDANLYLRIAPELYLKRCVAGGLERVFEIGRVFRNEGISPRHNPEFTMLEAYAAYADLGDMMTITEELVAALAVELHGSTCIKADGRTLDLTPPWPRRPMLDLVNDAIGQDLNLGDAVSLAAACREAGVQPEPGWGAGRMVSELYEALCEGHIEGPVFVVDYPVEISPLARAHRNKPGFAERFEAIVNGSELANAFTELVDPDDQRERFLAQAALRASGDADAMPLDEDYLEALRFGLPPTGGLGIGIDRLVMLLTGAKSIRDVVLFPTLKQRPTALPEPKTAAEADEAHEEPRSIRAGTDFPPQVSSS